MCEIEGDARLRIICRRCGAPSHVMVERGRIIDGPRNPGIEPSGGGTAL